MLTKFSAVDLIASKNYPTILAYDAKLANLVIGDDARLIASSHQPVVENFKVAIGETDAMFEGRFLASSTARPQRLWEVKYSGKEEERLISTRSVTKEFLDRLLKNLGPLPERLIIGTPASKDRAWLAQYRSHLTSVLDELGFPDTQFFPEPFAVFQYYRHVVQLIPDSSQPLVVLVIDFGGGTMDSCVIETTAEGNLSRGGTTSLPLGVQSCFGAGKEIDKRLLKIAVAKINDPIIKKDSVDARVLARPWVLLTVEQMKIALAAKLQSSRFDDDCSHFQETFILPVGSYHPDKHVQLNIDGEDLKRAIKELWLDKNGPGATIVATINEAKHRKGAVHLQQLDTVILAGGSSRLPFLKELVTRSINGQIAFKPENVHLGSNQSKL